jgi:hypothetical protein
MLPPKKKKCNNFFAKIQIITKVNEKKNLLQEICFRKKMNKQNKTTIARNKH